MWRSTVASVTSLISVSGVWTGGTSVVRRGLGKDGGGGG